ncbi:MAG: hypothetical protein CL681_00330 [Blastopirellula sp.]|nr:hypothetical protein [Blastopirellula sp.]
MVIRVSLRGRYDSYVETILTGKGIGKINGIDDLDLLLSSGQKSLFICFKPEPDVHIVLLVIL